MAEPSVAERAELAAPAEAPEPRGRRWLDFAVPIGLFLATIGTRLPDLARPNAFVFDEIYYALDGADMVRRGIERGGVVHPPVGKWIIGVGIWLYGFTPLGWRAGALVSGAVVVVLVYLTARQITGGYALPALAGGLAMLDGVAYTTGRIAMLDVFVALFTMLAVYFTVAAIRHSSDARRVRRYRWATAVTLGFGIATKWTVGYILLVCLIGFLALHARAPAEHRQGRAVTRTILTLVLVPMGVYVLTYVPWLVKADQTGAGYVECTDHNHCSFSLWDRLVLFKDDQQRILTFHTKLKSENNSNADFAYYWINQSRPAVLFRKTCVPQLQQAPPALNDGSCTGAAPNDVMEIITVANPVVWFVGLAAGLVLIVKVIRRGDIMALLLLLFFFYQWFPWLIDPFAIKDAVLHGQWGDVLQQRRAYSFYLSGMIPVLAIWPSVALARSRLRWIGWVVAGTTVASFAYYLPIWSGHPMSPQQISGREYWTMGSR